MKKPIPSLLAISAVTLGLSLTSCVDPYAATYGSASVTTYDPGYTVRTLPSGYRTEIVSGTTYYYHNGSYFRPRDNRYIVVDAPRSSRYYDEYRRHRGGSHRDRDRDRYRDQRDSNVRVITRLPDGSRQVTVRGNTYYQHRDDYYRRQGSGYVTVARPF